MNVASTISGEHAVIRELLASLGDAARRLREGGGITALRDAARALDAIFRAHLALEESLLVPLLPPDRADRLRREHRQQTTMLEAILAEVEHDARDPIGLANDSLWLVRALGRDMDAEDLELARIAA
jgi:hypothetical protein